MKTKSVVRVLDREQQLLAWAEVWLETRGDGALWATRPRVAPVERAGTPCELSIHLADINYEVLPRPSFAHKAVEPGDQIVLDWRHQPVVKFGDPPQNLPPVTVRQSVVVGIPVGDLGVVAT